jgi:hypothetical protein
MSKTGMPRVIFLGNKFFWRSRITIDVTIVEHRAFNITEIVSFDAALDKESERIYLNSSILSTKIDHTDVETKLSFAKQNDVPHTEEFINSVIHRATADYIVNRLAIASYSVETKTIEVLLEFNFRDRDLELGGDSIDKLICEKPADLEPYRSKNQRILA